VCWAWVPPLEEDDAYHDEHLHASVLRGTQHVLRHVKRHVLRQILRRVLHVLVIHVLVLTWTLPGVGLASGSPCAAAYLFSLPPEVLRWGGSHGCKYLEEKVVAVAVAVVKVVRRRPYLGGD